MTKEQVPQDVIDKASKLAFEKFKRVIEMAFDNGGMDAVVDVCSDLTACAAKSDLPAGVQIYREWRGIDFINEKFPGCAINPFKYLAQWRNSQAFDFEYAEEARKRRDAIAARNAKI